MNHLPSIPKQITERYEIERPLGRGGFATVYLALDKNLKRQVAVKIYHLEDDKDAAMVGKEAELLAKLQHHNIVRVYDVCIIEEEGKANIPYLVMEYLSGGSLREKLKPNAPPMRPQDALGLVAVLAEALDAAHDADILHLDIKPENILFDRQGRPYLTDFGIGRAMGGDEETKQTRAMGTNNYASPEQKTGGKLMRASDIYSLGVVLFELLTNQLPLGPAAAVPHPPYSPPFAMGHPLTAAKDLVLLVCKALAVAPTYRYESASAFAQHLRDYIQHSSGDTGRLIASSNPRQFTAPTITPVQIREPERELRPSDRHRVPRTEREMTHDLPPVLPGTRVTSMTYSHQAFEVGSGSVIEQGVFARGLVRIKQDAVVKGDIISLTMLDISQGVQANNLLAPEVMVRGPIRLAGSIFCRRLRPVQGENESAIHLPDNSELGGSLIFGADFERIIADADMGRALNDPRPPIEVFHRPMVRVGGQCTLVAILGDVDVVVEPRQKQLNTIRVQGNVMLGRFNTVRRVEGENVHIGPDCIVDEVHATGKLVIGIGSRVGYVRASQGIDLANRVTIASPVLFSDNGTIVEQGSAKWLVNEAETDLVARHLFDDQRKGKQGSLATILLDHRLNDLYERIAPGWLASLKAIAYEGTGERVKVIAPPASPPEGAGSYSDFTLDLTPASARPSEPLAEGESDVLEPLPPRPEAEVHATPRGTPPPDSPPEEPEPAGATRLIDVPPPAPPATSEPRARIVGGPAPSGAGEGRTRLMGTSLPPLGGSFRDRIRANDKADKTRLIQPDEE